jgi:hypothetical protein
VGVVAASCDTLKAEKDDDDGHDDDADDADDDDGDDDGDVGKPFKPMDPAVGRAVSEEAAVRVAGESDSVKEAPVPNVDRLERTEFSPRVEQEQEREQGQEQKQEQERLSAQSIGQ